MAIRNLMYENEELTVYVRLAEWIWIQQVTFSEVSKKVDTILM